MRPIFKKGVIATAALGSALGLTGAGLGVASAVSGGPNPGFSASGSLGTGTGTLASVNVPAGSYLITDRVTATSYGYNSAGVQCYVSHSGGPWFNIRAFSYPSNLTVPTLTTLTDTLVGGDTVNTASTYTLACYSTSGGWNETGQIILQRVSSLNGVPSPGGEG